MEIVEEENKLDNFLSHYKLPLAMGVVGAVLLIGGIVSSGILSKSLVKSTKQPASYTSSQVGPVKVDVSGAVTSPGVYTLPTGSRIEDAIKAAGGVTEAADPAYLSKTINLAQKISDGMKIYVPRGQEASNLGSQQAGQSGSVAGVSEGLININNATGAQLDQLPGVGTVTSSKIIDGRPYGSIEELLTKKVVSRAVYDKIKEKVSVY
ncbi:MAG: SLBB domain-containing protein [Candidatus Daviesbacteria bacterium]